MMTPNMQTIMHEPAIINSVGGGSRLDLLQDILVTTIGGINDWPQSMIMSQFFLERPVP